MQDLVSFVSRSPYWTSVMLVLVSFQALLRL